MEQPTSPQSPAQSKVAEPETAALPDWLPGNQDREETTPAPGGDALQEKAETVVKESIGPSPSSGRTAASGAELDEGEPGTARPKPPESQPYQAAAEPHFAQEGTLPPPSVEIVFRRTGDEARDLARLNALARLLARYPGPARLALRIVINGVQVRMDTQDRITITPELEEQLRELLGEPCLRKLEPGKGAGTEERPLPS